MRGQGTRSLLIGVVGILLVAGAAVQAQVNTVDLSGQVLDPQGLAIPGATVTVKNLATGATRAATADDTGRYRLVGLPPGRYELTVEGGKGLAKLVNPELILTIGQAAEFDAHMKIQSGTDTITVTEATELVEVNRTAVAETVDQRRINNLPINGRNYIQFTLTASQANRDSAPSIGAAPTSGINFGGQRARSNQVSVDGADATDNSVNGVRATVSQEAVQEFQIIVSNYMPEFGRATGGVINIVTKGGSNDVHGNVFGFFRHKDLQARNPFSVGVDPATGNTVPVKQGFTRVQTGATIGGPIKKDRTFYFFSYETTRRQETGFTNIGANNFGVSNCTTPAVAGVTLQLTAQQCAFVNNPAVLTAPGGGVVAANVFLLAGSASSVALNGIDPGAIANARGITGTPAGPRFPLPIDCLPPAIPCASGNLVPLPASFVRLNSLRGNYPTKEGSSLWSARLDHEWNDKNNTFVRVSVAPSEFDGIQVNAQNQNLGQNAGSRTSLQRTRDFALVAQHVTSLSRNIFNEARFQYARRGLHYGFASLPGGDQVGVNMAGFAFFGREPFSTVDRIERRLQWTDNMSWILGQHTFKFGADYNLIQLRSKETQIFELNFGGLFNFGALSAASLGLPSTIGGVSVPGLTAVQAYGIGVPQVFIQGIGNSDRPLNNHVLGIFLQDSWKIHRRLTLNYGVRYDYEKTPLFDPSTSVNAVAQQVFGVTLGIPRDTNNVSPRFALAWDPWGQGKTIVRAGYGLFYDHPLLAVAFNSVTADGAISTQLLSGGGTASRVALTVNPLALNASSIFQGVLNAIPSMGYLASQQRFDPKLPNSLFANQNFLTAGFPIPILPFVLPVANNFEFGYAQQANLTVEHQAWNDYKFGIGYTFTKGLHLNRPRDVNTPDPLRLANNFRNALAAGLSPASPLSVAAPAANRAATAATCGVTVIAPNVLGALSGCPGPLAPLNGQFLGTAAFFNFFRRSGPNPSFAGLAGGYANQVGLATLAGYPTGFPGVQIPWGGVDQQESSGISNYHGMTLTVSKRYSKNFEFLSSYTYSHAIDDSTDLQTLLEPQDTRLPRLERGNSSFDQRHRWVTSAVLQSPYKRGDDGFWHKFLADFTLAPIVEVASGRPFTVLTGTDFNLNFGSNTDRPSVVSSGGVSSPFISGVTFVPANVCDGSVSLGPATISPPTGCRGDLGRNTFTRPGFFTFDLRVARKIYFGERWNVELIADMFNLFNRFNVGDVSPLCNPLDPANCRAGEPTAALDVRQFQFAIKINW